MSIHSRLKKEGIQIIEKLDTEKVNKISINVASKLCLAFPEHSLKRNELFEAVSGLSMYIAKMPQDSSGAKYFYKDNSIYFNEIFDIEEMSKLAVHECIHFIQNSNNYNNKSRMGLYDSFSNSGLGLNEAAVQLMASEANFIEQTTETYFGVSINTISPDYYPLECSLVNELAYFTGTYPLYHSTLYSNDVFKNTFILKSDKKSYSTIVKNLDKLLSLEDDLNYLIQELQYADKVNSIKLLNNLINKNKHEIMTLFFRTQNLIIEKCFKGEFNNIRNLDDINAFNQKLYNFKNIIGYSDDYTFYNEFYRKMMNLVQEKRSYIEKYGEINLFENINKSLMLVDNTKFAFSFIKTFISKCKKLFGLNRSRENINDLY